MNSGAPGTADGGSGGGVGGTRPALPVAQLEEIYDRITREEIVVRGEAGCTQQQQRELAVRQHSQ
jgi:hypothetical protein